MSIPLSHVVNVTISLSPTAIALAGFGQLGFVTDETPKSSAKFRVADRVRVYSSLSAVEADWEPTSEVVAAAIPYYAQRATIFVVILASAAETSAVLRGGEIEDLSAALAIDNDSFDIEVDGSTINVTGFDLTAAGDLSGVATALTTAITGVTATVSDDKLVLTTDSVGKSSNIAIPSVSEATTALGLIGGAKTETGLGVETPKEALSAARIVNNIFYGVLNHRKWRDSQAAVDTADWVEAQGLMFFNTSNNPASLTADDTHIIAQLKAKTLDRTISTYSSSPREYPSAALAGRAFIVNFEGTNTTITLNLKQAPTITVEDLDTNEKLNLESHNGNAVCVIAGVNVISDSRMASGQFLDTIHGTDWLTNRIETDVFNVKFQSNTKIPYTDEGVSVLRQAAEGGLRQAVTNGLVAPGNDAEGNFVPLGYELFTIPVSQVSPSDKSNRIYRGLSFKAVGAGAIHSSVIDGNFNS